MNLRRSEGRPGLSSSRRKSGRVAGSFLSNLLSFKPAQRPKEVQMILQRIEGRMLVHKIVISGAMAAPFLCL